MSSSSSKPIKIRENYIPKHRRTTTAKGTLSSASKLKQACPRCGESIPVDEMEQHVKIELLDPKWRQQRAKASEKNKYSNIINNSIVSDNLRRLAQARSDIFGGDEQQLVQRVDGLKSTAIIWDGQKESINTIQLQAQTSISQQELEGIEQQQQQASSSSQPAKRPLLFQPFLSSYSYILPNPLSAKMAAVFLFHRDLRLFDNTALTKALAHKIIPVFIFENMQIDRTLNSYFSDSSVQFMCESLTDLNNQLETLGSKLQIYHGDTFDILAAIYTANPFTHFYTNSDYTPFAKFRDSKIKTWCQANSIEFHAFEDYALLPIKDALVRSPDAPYQKFTPFYNSAVKNCQIRKVNEYQWKRENFMENCDIVIEPVEANVSVSKLSQFYTPNSKLIVKGGVVAAFEKLDSLAEHANYKVDRDFPSKKAGTTVLSPYLKFGQLSVRQVYWKIRTEFGESHDLIRQLYWRDFYLKIGNFKPHVFGSSMTAKYDKVPWNTDEQTMENFEKWKTGMTGFPIVDAAMRSLNTQGWMHNRLRMVVASFLTKNLLIDWKWGEKYFATQLVDYDPAQNNGGWQWASGSGADSQPYFRVFNPWLQAAKFDALGTFVKKWVPELAACSAKELVKPEGKRAGYPRPIVDASASAKVAIEAYKNALQ